MRLDISTLDTYRQARLSTKDTRELYAESMDAAARLREARKAAGFSSARQAALAMSISYPTYAAHENGEKGFVRTADRYARFYRVSLEWLVTGKGDMRSRKTSIPLMGSVGAGSTVEMIGDACYADAIGDVDLPDTARTAALIVRGESQYPKWEDGDIILYSIEPEDPIRLVGQYCVAHTVNGEMLLKKLQRGTSIGRWILWSHNAPPAEVELLAVHRYLGTIAH